MNDLEKQVGMASTLYGRIAQISVMVLWTTPHRTDPRNGAPILTNQAGGRRTRCGVDWGPSFAEGHSVKADFTRKPLMANGHGQFRSRGRSRRGAKGLPTKVHLSRKSPLVQTKVSPQLKPKEWAVLPLSLDSESSVGRAVRRSRSRQRLQVGPKRNPTPRQTER